MCSLQRWQAHNKLSPAVHKLPDATVHRMQGAGSPWESSTWKEKTCLVSLVTKTPFVRDPSLTPLPLKDLSPVLEEDGCVPVCSFALSFTRGAYRRGWWCDIGHKKMRFVTIWQNTNILQSLWVANHILSPYAVEFHSMKFLYTELGDWADPKLDTFQNGHSCFKEP